MNVAALVIGLVILVGTIGLGTVSKHMKASLQKKDPVVIGGLSLALLTGLVLVMIASPIVGILLLIVALLGGGGLFLYTCHLRSSAASREIPAVKM